MPGLTTPDASVTRMAEIQERLDNAAARPWSIVRHDLDIFIESADMGLQANLGYVGNRPQAEAELIVNAPDDIEFLMAEVARYKAATKAVKAMAAEWDLKTAEGARGFQADVDTVLSEHLSQPASE